MNLSRRDLLLAGGATAWATWALPSWAQSVPDRRFVFIILRGAMDGLHAIVPYGDPAYTSARGAMAFAPPGTGSPLLDLDGFYALHPALQPLQSLYKAGEFAAFHAVASPYRDRSHFDGQDVLESGGSAPHRLADGWLNRALIGGEKRLRPTAIGSAIPLILRGDAPAGAWAPSPLAGLDPAQVLRLATLYQGDPVLHLAFEEGVQMAAVAAEAVDADGSQPKGRKFAALASATGRLMAAAEGPRVVVMEAGGWDTHAGQGLENGRMAGALRDLADGIVALAQTTGPAWRRTIVVAASEFGRTVHSNGTGGTDHGTGGTVLLAGGALKGGRVIADWPGLGTANLHQGRDLKPTMDLRAVLKGVLSDHLQLASGNLNRAFPGAESVPPIQGLIRA